jgi:hypothetical protein
LELRTRAGEEVAEILQLATPVGAGGGLRQVTSPVSHFVLQTGSEVIDVGRGDVQGHAVFQERRPVAANRIASKLYQ